MDFSGDELQGGEDQTGSALNPDYTERTDLNKVIRAV
jgi:hypothetical protein